MRNSNKRSKKRQNSSHSVRLSDMNVRMEMPLHGKMTINSIEKYFEAVRWNLINMVEDANSEYLESIGIENRDVVDYNEREWRVRQQLVLELDEAYGYVRKFLDHVRLEMLAFDHYDEDGNPKIQGDVPFEGR